MRLPKTINIQVGRKLSDRSKDEIMKEVASKFSSFGVVAIQIGYEIVRVTFDTDDHFKAAKEKEGLHLFGLWCPILGGSPPITILHIFDYPYEEPNANLETMLLDYGVVKKIKMQTFLSNQNIYTGTCLVTIVLDTSPPRQLSLNGYNLRVWYKGQPLICNLCAVQGHKSADCPNRDKCRRCGLTGHFARNCPRPWGAYTDPLFATGGLEGVSEGPAPDPTADEDCHPLFGPALMDTHSIDFDDVASNHSEQCGDSNGIVEGEQDNEVDAVGEIVLNENAVVEFNDEAVNNAVVDIDPGQESVDDSVSGEASGPTEVSPQSSASDAPIGDDPSSQDLYDFTCGQDVPSSQDSLESSESVLRGISSSTSNVSFLEKDGIAETRPSLARTSSLEKIGSEYDSRSLLGKIRKRTEKFSRLASSKKKPGKHNLPQVVSSKPKSLFSSRS